MKEFLKSNFRWIAGGFLLTYCSSFGQTFFVSASVAEWQAAFQMSHGEFGRLYMFATLASALCLPIVGRLVDSMPEPRTILFSMPVLAAASLLAAYAPSIVVLAFALFLLRLFGQGMLTHIALTATGRWFSRERGRAVSLVVLGHQGGEATLPLLAAMISLAYGYQMAWVAGAVALLLAGLPISYWAYRQPRTPYPSEPSAAPHRQEALSWTRAQVLRDPVFWILLSGVLAPAFIGTTVFFHQDYLTQVNDWPPGSYALSLSVLALSTVVFALICGALIDRLSARSVISIFLPPLAASCFVLGRGGPAEMLFGAMALLGMSYGFSSTLFGAIWPEIYGTQHLGAIRSLVLSMMVFATAAGPGVTGTLIDAGVPLASQLDWLGLYCLVAVGMMAFASWRLRRRRRDLGAGQKQLTG